MGIKDLPLEKQELTLDKMRNEWIPSILKAIVKGHKKCKKCGKYSHDEEYIKTSKTEVRNEYTCIDGGYGEDDVREDVEYLLRYAECPKCHYKEQLNRLYIRTIRGK